MLDSYTRLLETVAETEDKAVADAAVTKLIAHLKSSGRMATLPKIARELRRIAARRRAIAPRVEVAHEKESAAALRAAATFGIVAKHAEVNPALIHGWRAQSGGKLIDHSAKHALAQIYQKVIV
ncbi:MAG: F0F1 ATP synthase subunit delta [Minisyncoccota bacterium]